MKLITIFLTCLVTGSSVFGQAKSDIVGYISLGNTTGGVAVPANTDVTFSVPLANKTEYYSTVSASSSTSVTLVSGTLGNVVDFSTGDPYVVTVTSGSQEGAAALIDSNLGDVISITNTNQGDFAALATSDTVGISKAWTISSVFDQVLPAGTQVFAFDSSTQNINESSTQGYVTNGSGDWFQIIGGSGPANDTILYPGESFIIRTAGDAIASLSLSGVVPEYNSRVDVAKTASGNDQDVRIAYNSPVSETVIDSGLGFNPGDQLLIFDQTSTGINKSATKGIVWSGSSWFGIIGLTGPQDDFVLEAGEGYVYRHAANSPTQDNDWNNQQTYRNNL